MHTIETGNPENLFGLWSLFSKCSPAMEDGRRYENMAWRVWGRETLCCPPLMVSPPWAFDRQLPANNADMPELSTSVASDDSNVESPLTTTSRSTSSTSRPGLRRHDSTASQARGKHLTPIDLEKVVNSIQEKKAIEPLSPLPPQLAPPAANLRIIAPVTTCRPVSPPSTARRIPQPATSPLAAIRGSDAMALSPPAHSEISSSLEASNHSVVRGFEPGHISTSIRSTASLAPTPILKKTSSFLMKPLPFRAEPMTKKKQPMFTLGGSSDEDNCSSLEAYSLAQRSSLSEHLRQVAPLRKTLSFKKEVNTRTYHDAVSDSDGAIETDSEDEPDESAIEDDDSEGDWEDENDDSGPSSVNEQSMFKRVDSKPNLVSRRSLLTTMMHEGDRAQALQNAASRSTPAIRRSRTSTPNGPSIGNSPQEDSGLMMRQQVTRAKPIIMTTSNMHPPALSPRTTRRNMLQTELSGSLRQNLLWERQQKNATTNAVAKRQQSAVNLPALRRTMTANDIERMDKVTKQKPVNPMITRDDNNRNNSSYNDYFDQGLQEYHAKGW